MAKAPPISVRIPADVLERLDSEAGEGLTRNAIIIACLRLRYKMDPASNERGNTPGKPESIMQIGPIAETPGSRLKQAPKGRDKWAR